MIRVRLKANE